MAYSYNPNALVLPYSQELVPTGVQHGYSQGIPQMGFQSINTSKKHRNFVGEPMGEKLVTELAGIGPILGGRLAAVGFTHAYHVFGQFLVLSKNEELFVTWIKYIIFHDHYAKVCCNCLKEWCNNFM